MSTLTLRAIQAKHGDSLLLFAEGATILIDGGPSGVYRQNLRDQLLTLERDGINPPKIDLMMVSHIDADHIDGILDLTFELREAKQERREPIVNIKRVWHNSFSDLIATAVGESEQQVTASAASVASLFGQINDKNFSPHESKMVLESVGQGRQLRYDLETLKIKLNRHFDDKIVLQGNARPWECGDLRLSVIGPTQKEVDKLRKLWKKKLKDLLEKESAASTASALKFDYSVPNLASIVAIAEVEDKSILLTGDARGDMILRWLEKAGRLAPQETLHFDVIKLPHHGSDRNVTPEFFERITADHYVICGDGNHGNPEPATFEMLFIARPCLDYKIHLTYGPEVLKENSKFIKAGNVDRLDAVLADPSRLQTLVFPQKNETYIDITL